MPAGEDEGKGGSGQSDTSASRSISRPVKWRKPTGIPNSEDYDSGLSYLWGEETLKQLRRFVSNGSIKEKHIKAMATMMGVKRVFNENNDKAGADVRETFESMLEEWYNQKLFNLTPQFAADELMRVLSHTRCHIDQIYVTRIQNSLNSSINSTLNPDVSHPQNQSSSTPTEEVEESEAAMAVRFDGKSNVELPQLGEEREEDDKESEEAVGWLCRWCCCSRSHNSKDTTEYIQMEKDGEFQKKPTNK